jgi:phospholipase C
MTYPAFQRRFALLMLSSLLSTVSPSVCAAQSEAAATSPNTSHSIQTVFLILMENHNWTGNGTASIKGNASALYINHMLLAMASHAENYNNPPSIHPSLPNYLWLEAGTNFGIQDDGSPSQHSQATRSHLVTLLQANIAWKSYDEDISGRDCPVLSEGPRTATAARCMRRSTTPFVYFDDVDGLPQSEVCQLYRPHPAIH